MTGRFEKNSAICVVGLVLTARVNRVNHDAFVQAYIRLFGAQLPLIFFSWIVICLFRSSPLILHGPHTKTASASRSFTCNGDGVRIR